MSFVMFSFPGSMRVSHDFDNMFDDLFQNAFNPPLFDLEEILFAPSFAYTTFLRSEPVYPQTYLPIYDTGANLFQRLFSALQNDSLFDSEIEDLPPILGEGMLPDYTEATQHNNAVRHERALAQNQDGAAYFQTVIRDHLNTLSQEDKSKFKEMMESCDPEIFIKLAQLAVKKAISRPDAINEQNLPGFLHPHVPALKAIHGNDANAIGAIATALHRDTNCIASMQQAIQKS